MKNWQISSQVADDESIPEPDSYSDAPGMYCSAWPDTWPADVTLLSLLAELVKFHVVSEFLLYWIRHDLPPC